MGKAFMYQETDEWTGGIVFAGSNIEARRIGANLLDRDGIGGMSVHRRADLDRYESEGVPARVLVADGWWFECSGCGMRVDEDNLIDEGMSTAGVVGVEGGRVYCCHTCQRDDLARRAAKKAFGEAYLDMMRDIVRRRFPGIDHRFEDHRHHYYVDRCGGEMCVRDATVEFSFPGGQYSVSLRMRHAGQYGKPLIGPVRPEFFGSNGDREAFEAFARATKPQGSLSA
jgi:hypothetical protein